VSDAHLSHLHVCKLHIKS